MALDYIGYAHALHGGYRAVRAVHHHRHRIVVALAFIIPFITYAFSVSHDVASRDLADMQGVPYLLGIAHPTGYPLFVLIGWVWSHVVSVGTLAYRMNLFGAVCMSLACMTGVVTAIRIGIGPVTSLGAFLCFAWARSIWYHGSQADSQDLALLFQAMTIYYLCGWLIHSRTRDIVAMAASFGAAIAVSPISLWLLPAIIFSKLVRLRRITLAGAGAALVAFVLLLCCYAYLPLRANAIAHAPVDPVQMLAPPAARVYWDVNDPRTQQGFVNEVSGLSFGVGPLWRNAANPSHWLAYLGSIYATIHGTYDIVFVVVAGLGIILLFQRRNSVCIMLVIAALSAGFVALALAPVEGDPERYLMFVLWIAALFAGGVTAEFRWTVDPRRIVWALILIGNAIALAGASGSVAALQRGVSNRALISWIARSVPAKAIVVAPWEDATTLAYGAYADGSLQDRTILAAHPRQYASDYALWARREPLYVLSAVPFADPRFHPVGTPTLGRMLYVFGGT
ncbi:MAG: protein O-mannosyl-transferase family [Candidatus Tyrphobacter sp.]